MAGERTPQEDFWEGSFGDEYAERNREELLSLNVALFAKILARTANIHSVLEFGANIGLNLRALKCLCPEVELSAIEINQKAVNELKLLDGVRVYHTSILDFIPDYPRDLTFTKGVLIHISPEKLPLVYDTLYQASKRYVCVSEYYNPTPVSLTYRGHQDRLFKRDFAGELLDRFKDLRLVDYGFAYHRDPVFPQGDLTWFLLEKAGAACE